MCVCVCVSQYTVFVPTGRAGFTLKELTIFGSTENSMQHPCSLLEDWLEYRGDNEAGWYDWLFHRWAKSQHRENHSVTSDSATPWTMQSMEFSRPEYWSGEPFPSLGDLPNPGIEARSPALQADSLPAESKGKPEVSSRCMDFTLFSGSGGETTFLKWLFVQSLLSPTDACSSPQIQGTALTSGDAVLNETKLIPAFQITIQRERGQK